MIAIPFYEGVSSKFSLQVDLDDDGTFTLYIYWNSRDNAWYMDIKDEFESIDILTGIRLCAEYGILQQYRGLPNVPAGEFYITDDEGKIDGLSFDNIGIDKRFKMNYVNKGELSGL